MWEQWGLISGRREEAVTAGVETGLELTQWVFKSQTNLNWILTAPLLSLESSGISVSVSVSLGELRANMSARLFS